MLICLLLGFEYLSLIGLDKYSDYMSVSDVLGQYVIIQCYSLLNGIQTLSISENSISFFRSLISKYMYSLVILVLFKSNACSIHWQSKLHDIVTTIKRSDKSGGSHMNDLTITWVHWGVGKSSVKETDEQVHFEKRGQNLD